MSQIEIEKKFQPTEAQLVQLVNGATLLGRKELEDSYFDTDAFDLRMRDYWFRMRDGAYELKTPLFSPEHRESTATNQYHELTTLPEIREALGVPAGIDFEEALARAGIKKFVTAHTTRNRYKKEAFEIDVDTVTYDDSSFRYNLVEIELLLEDTAYVDEAEAKIIAFALRHGLDTSQNIDGKIVAFMKAEYPTVYDAFVQANVA